MMTHDMMALLNTWQLQQKLAIKGTQLISRVPKEEEAIQNQKKYVASI